MQEVICECYNCSTGQSDGWRGMLSQFIAMGLQNPCLESGQWFPKPAQCPGDGSDYVPPPFGGCPPDDEPPPPPPTDGPPPTNGVPPGDGVPPPGGCPPFYPSWRPDVAKCCIAPWYSRNEEGECVGNYDCQDGSSGSFPAAVDSLCAPPVDDGPPPPTDGEPTEPPPLEEESLACPVDGTFDLYDALTGEHIASNVAEADLPPGAEIVAADDERCGPGFKGMPAPEDGVPEDGLPPGDGLPPTDGIPTDGLPGAAPPSGGIPAGGVPGTLPGGAPGAVPTTTSPFGAPGAAKPAPGTSPASAFQPTCSNQIPINVQQFRTETRAPGPGTWQNQWNA